MNPKFAPVLGRTFLVLLVPSVAAWIVWRLTEAAPPTIALVFYVVLYGTMPANVHKAIRGAMSRPLHGESRNAALIGFVGLLALASSWLLVPVWSARIGVWSDGIGWWWYHLDPWSHVCWPVLLGEQALILVITGGLLTWVVRRERRRRAAAESF